MAFAQRQAESVGLAQPRVDYCDIILLKHSWPHEGRELKAEEMLVVHAAFVVDGAPVVV